MKKFLLLFLLALFTITVQAQSNENYIKTTEFHLPNKKVPENLILNSAVSNTAFKASKSIILDAGFHATSNVTLQIVDPTSAMRQESIIYYDGLGKPKQQIAIGQSPNRKDIVQHIAYDEFGRVSQQYLPHEYTEGTLGSYRTDAGLSTKAYYKTHYPEDFPGIADVNLITPYSERTFELSPLNRIEKQSTPGELLKMGSGHEVKFEYKVNIANEVKRYVVNSDGSLESNISYYATNTLQKSIVKDQNWQPSDGKNHTSETFKNKLGKTILSRSYNNNEPYDTYYVYDHLDNLRYVLPPNLIDAYSYNNYSISKRLSNSINQIVFDNLAYQYKYDEWNRLIEKKLPGKPWEYIVYDTHDRPILTQDGALREQNLWAFTKYDTYGRNIYTGLYSSSKSRNSLQVDVDNFINTNNKNNSEDRITTTKNIGGILLNYENIAFPTTNITEVLAVNYYDDYAFTDFDKPVIPTRVLKQTVTTRTNGLETASWVKTLGENTWSKSYTFYDEKAREICVHAKNYLGGSTIVESKIQFNGTVRKTIATHKKTASNKPVTIKDFFTYDHAKRLLTQEQKIKGGTQENIAQNSYDGLGMLIQKKVGGSTTALQTIDYTYNIRGALKTINDVENNLTTTSDNDLFAYKLNYENPLEGSVSADQIFNGTISQSIWRNRLVNKKQSYTYNYDALNRIKSAAYRRGASLNARAGKYELSNIDYDKGGNIQTLQRTGAHGVIDNLEYFYQSQNGVTYNKLIDVTDSTSNVEGYKDINASGDNYIYDANGRLIADKNKGISNIQYNYLDLPTKITFSNGNKIEITYDAAGNKLEKLYVTASGTTETLYIDGFQYQDNQLLFFGHPEGYIYKDGTNYKYAYVYNDHLGNNRLSYSDVDGNGSISTSEIFSKTDYFPFGLSHGEYIAGFGSNYKYKYQGKELQEENGLQQYDFGSRMYDAATGRWHVLDPQAEAFYGISPYMAMGNNPIMMVDPNGEVSVLAFAGPIFRGLAFVGELISNTVHGKSDIIGRSWKNSTNIYNGMSSIPLYQNENTNISLNPFGASINISQKIGNFTVSGSVGVQPWEGTVKGVGDPVSWNANGGAGFNDGTTSFGGSFGGGRNYTGWSANYRYKGYGGSFGKTTYGNEKGPDDISNSQIVGVGNLYFKDFSIRIENDTFGDGHDRWRSNALQLMYKDFILGTTLYNNLREKKDGKNISERYLHYDKDGKTPLGRWINGQTYSSPVYFGVKMAGNIYRFNYSHRSIQDFLQNKVVHKKGILWGLFKKGRANYFMDYDHFKKGFYFNAIQNNPYTLWGNQKQ